MGVVNVGEDRDGDLFRTQSKDLLSFVFVTVYIYIYICRCRCLALNGLNYNKIILILVASFAALLTHGFECAK